MVNFNSSSESTPSATSALSSTSTTRIRKKAFGARTGPGWNHRIDLGDGKVMCTHCKLTFSGGIYRLKHHLARTSINVAPCPQVPKNVRLEFASLLEESSLATKKKRGVYLIDENEETYEKNDRGNMQNFVTKKGKVQNTLNSIYKKDEREKVCQQDARFFLLKCNTF